MKKLSTKRKRVIYTILIATISNIFVTAAPLIDFTTLKKLLLTFINVVMFIIVWDTYFDEQLAQKDTLSIVQDLFAVTCLSVITTFILSQGITIMIERLLALLDSLGWVVAGTIAGLATVILGVIWASYCDDLYRNSTS